jgi:hypothetical protein
VATSLQAGYHAVNADDEFVESGGTAEVICPSGHFCSGGDKTACNDIGTLCLEGSSAPSQCPKGSYCSNPSSSAICSAGQSCPEGTQDPQECPAGASCNVPGATELIIIPNSIIEKRESELEPYEENPALFQFSYELSLSAPPKNEVVTVNIAMMRSRNITCIQQEKRITLTTSELTFSNDTYNISQTVLAVVNVSNSYQGPLGVVFEHSVETADLNWQAPFLLPVFLTILDDDACTQGAAQLEDDNNVRICQCEEGYFIDSIDPNFCGSATCTPCEEGMACDPKPDENAAEAAAKYRSQSLASVLIDPGMYRVDADSAVVVSCPIDSACVGNATAGDLLCDTGRTGPMCQVCLITDEMTYVKSNDECVPCESSHQGIMYGLLAAVLVVMVLAAYVIMRHTHKENVALKLNSKLERFSRQILTKYKIVLKVLQTLSKIVTLYPEITFPAVFTSVVSKCNIFVDLDVNILPFNCIASTNFHDKLLVMTLFPIAFIAYIGLVFVHQRRKINASADLTDGESWMRIRKKMGKLEADCIYYTLVFVYTIFSLVSTTIIQTFNYDDRLKTVTGESYLIADYTIQESDPVHRAYVAYAAVMFVLYCIGIPAASLYLLRKNKVEIQELQRCVYELAEKEEEERNLRGVQDDSVCEVRSESDFSEPPSASHILEANRKRLRTLEADIQRLQTEQKDFLEKNPRLRGLTPLYQDYEAGYYHFEVIQFVITLFLVAVAASLPVNSGSVVFLALVASGGMLLAFAWLKPYMNSGDDRDAFFAQIAITMTLCVGLLSLSASDEDPKDWAFGWLLILFTAVAVLVPVGMMLHLAALVFYNCDPGSMPSWMQFIYTHANEAAGGLAKLIDGCASLCSSSAGSTGFQTGRV